MKALIVGGTGPTGPYLIEGLIKRGYTVSMFHRGTHEIPETPAEVEHLHGDPHFLETIEETLAGRTFDLAIVTYGRIRYLAQALVGKVGRFVSVGGAASYAGYLATHALKPHGLICPVDENARLVKDESEHRFSYLIAQTEQAILDHHPDAAHFRYPYVYGPRQLIPREWSIMRRMLDKRPSIILPDAGLTVVTHGYAANLAHAVLLAVDHPIVSAGQIYNCGDEKQLSLRQVVEIIAQKMACSIAVESMPWDIALPSRAYSTSPTGHHMVLDISKIKAQLGYRDVYSSEQALGLTVDWLLENRPEPDGELEGRLQDAFDYAAEDRLIKTWHSCIETMKAVPIALPEERPHPYAHPKKAGERDHRNR